MPIFDADLDILLICVVLIIIIIIVVVLCEKLHKAVVNPAQYFLLKMQKHLFRKMH